MEITTRVQLHNWKFGSKYKLIETTIEEKEQIKCYEPRIDSSYDFITCLYGNTRAIAAYEKNEVVENDFHATMHILRYYDN